MRRARREPVVGFATALALRRTPSEPARRQRRRGIAVAPRRLGAASRIAGSDRRRVARRRRASAARSRSALVGRAARSPRGRQRPRSTASVSRKAFDHAPVQRSAASGSRSRPDPASADSPPGCRCRPSRRSAAAAAAASACRTSCRSARGGAPAAPCVRKRRARALEQLSGGDVAEVVGRQVRQQRQADVGRRGAMRDARDRDAPGSCRAAASGPRRRRRCRRTPRSCARSCAGRRVCAARQLRRAAPSGRLEPPGERGAANQSSKHRRGERRARRVAAPRARQRRDAPAAGADPHARGTAGGETAGAARARARRTGSIRAAGAASRACATAVRSDRIQADRPPRTEGRRSLNAGLRAGLRPVCAGDRAQAARPQAQLARLAQQATSRMQQRRDQRRAPTTRQRPQPGARQRRTSRPAAAAASAVGTRLRRRLSRSFQRDSAESGLRLRCVPRRRHARQQPASDLPVAADPAVAPRGRRLP